MQWNQVLAMTPKKKQRRTHPDQIRPTLRLLKVSQYHRARNDDKWVKTNILPSKTGKIKFKKNDFLCLKTNKKQKKPAYAIKLLTQPANYWVNVTSRLTMHSSHHTSFLLFFFLKHWWYCQQTMLSKFLVSSSCTSILMK